MFSKKRSSLEAFIHEQMIGPGGCRGKFTMSSAEDDDFDNNEEIINTTPGSIYSSAVLFPEKGQDDSYMSEDDRSDSIEHPDEEDADNPEEENMTRSDNNERAGAIGSDADDEDIYSLSRRFPNTIGISCCLESGTNIGKDVKIIVSGRYYTKIGGKDRCRVQIRIPDEYDEELRTFMSNYEDLFDYFAYSNKRLSVCHDIRTKKDEGADESEYSAVKRMLREINKSCAAELLKGESVWNEVNEDYRFLLSYRERLFKKLTRVSYDGSYLSENEKTDCIRLIEEIEKKETILSYFKDLMKMYDNRSYGFWRSHTFLKEVSLEDIPFDTASKQKQVYSPGTYPSLHNIVYVNANKRSNPDGEIEETHLSLSLWLQISHNLRDIEDDNLYLKVLLKNDSSKVDESNSNRFSIVNEQVNKYCFFGIKIEIESDKLKPYRQKNLYYEGKDEENQLNFLYRELKDYAIGHFCSTDWPVKKDKRVNRVFTEFMPSYETPDVEPIPRNKDRCVLNENNVYVPEPFLSEEDSVCLQFKWLSTFGPEKSNELVIQKLKTFVETYGNWIKLQRSKHFDNPEDKELAEKNLDKCQEDYDRMLANINGILSGDENKENMHIFREMNSAMFMQLWHKGNQGKPFENNAKTDARFYENAGDEFFGKGRHAAWRPFQLAFILLNLDGIIRHPDDIGWKKRNELVDLVWFPTGGGKTEAYLGLIALCIINRRRKHRVIGFGVTAIMRYTLRLLTAQQFQRALAVILALEEMRRWDEDAFGKEPISIGLFVGSGSLPNTFNGNGADKGLDEEARNWHQRQNGQNRTRIPLDKCPWCGSRLDYSSDKGEFFCTNDNCTFCENLPVKLCDEHIYETPPTLLFGTVDKFAAIAHKVSTNDKNKDSRRLFGRRKEGKCLPPDLIIQDELHLLLGPLGSAVSLFECAIDQLCTREEDGIRPKIISSTATTRNTGLQIRALYDRDVNIFPKNGISYDDSFFSFCKREKRDEDGEYHYISKRKYLGIMPTGRTQNTTQMRLAAILLVHRALFEKEYGKEDSKAFETVADNYYSVISYFNSLKELGQTSAMLNTEYSKYVKRLYYRVMDYGGLLENFYAPDNLKSSELSGRLNGNEINEKFTEVGSNWKKDDRLPHKKNGDNGEDKFVDGTTPPDYILATNMISVGLDIDRFNTIIMNSMPRNIAEYIQASSRVARKNIGLVLTSHNPFRARDVSHFERFKEFHEKLYYYVEPISITPFSQKSVEKYLPLYMAAIIRHSFEDLANNGDAGSINSDDKITTGKIKDTLFQYFKDRYEKTKALDSELQRNLLTDELLQHIEFYIDKGLNQWREMARSNPSHLSYEVYGYNKRHPGVALFTSPGDYDDVKNVSYWTVPISLRIVEPEAVLDCHSDYPKEN